MLYFLLPKTHSSIYTKLTCSAVSENAQISMSQSLAYYLYNIKEKIKGREDEWDLFKKYTNPYEFIHTSIPYKKKSVAKYKPLSRAYFKMVEIMESFQLYNNDKAFSSFHLAEGPGGFIEALAQLRNCNDDIYIGMTLLDDHNDETIPAWKKTNQFLEKHKNVFIENGADGTGNILSLANLEYCKSKYGSSMQIITGDGGFDFSVDFNNQEINIVRLLFAQICYALCMQKYNGCFVLKIFDCFTTATIELLYLLSSCYKRVYITKPQTSRYANSEKYLVCQGFLHESSDALYPFIKHAFESMMQIPENHSITHFLHTVNQRKMEAVYMKAPPGFDVIEETSRQHKPSEELVIESQIPYYFYKKIEEYNAVFGQQQIENIHATLSLIENKTTEKIENITKFHIQKCMQWCEKYNIPHVSFFSPAEN